MINENLERENFPFETNPEAKKKKKNSKQGSKLSEKRRVSRGKIVENCWPHFDSIALGEAQGARVCKDAEDTSRIRIVGIAG